MEESIYSYLLQFIEHVDLTSTTGISHMKYPLPGIFFVPPPPTSLKHNCKSFHTLLVRKYSLPFLPLESGQDCDNFNQ